MKVRPAESGDLEAILQLEQRTANAPHWTRAAYRQALDSAEHCLFVVGQSGIHGFSAGSVAAGEAELESVVVDLNSRRHGVGRELCEAVVLWAREAGAHSITLEVRSSSTGAVTLYRSLGFREFGFRPSYYTAPADDALILRLSLRLSVEQPN